MRLSTRAVALIIGSLAIVTAGFVLTAPVPQDPGYHEFADSRSILGIDNFWNVASNLPFLVVGVWGLFYLRQHNRSVCLPGMQSAFIVFFIGVFLTAFGSGYYHMSPANEPLVWDRLPMTIGFAGLFSIIIGELVSVRIARRILAPLLVIGLASVVYWAFTEARGSGDLRPYAVVQFLPMLLIPAVLLIYEPTIGSTKYYWLMVLFYILAKVFEYFDAETFSLGQLLSGHTLKHLFAALTPATMLYALAARRKAEAIVSDD